MLEKPLTIPESILEQLHCSSCQGFLSCGPVRVQADGSCICGRCSPLNTDAPVYRALAMEAILSRALFPCRFNQRGCAQFLLFGQSAEHESKCLFRSFQCPLAPSCSWDGSSLDIFVHFTKSHPELIQSAEFKLQVGVESEGMVMVISDGVGYLVKYHYGPLQGTLVYDVRYCRNDVIDDAGCKIRLINDSDPDCSASLKMSKCRVFTESFSGLHQGLQLNVNNFLANLDHPSCIKVRFAITRDVGKQGAVGYVVDFEVLNSLRCEKCHGYLIPPLFDADGWVICCDCAKNNLRAQPSTNIQLVKLATDTNFPCRWRDCKFVTRSASFKSHEWACPLRHYDCFFPSCRQTFKLAAAVEHLQGHRAQFLSDKLVYTATFLQPYNFRHVFTVRGNTIVVVQHSVVELEGVNKHRVALFSSDSDFVGGSVDFEHPHCKLKSKPFTVFNKQNTDVVLDKLPPCFKSGDELTVTVKV